MIRPSLLFSLTGLVALALARPGPTSAQELSAFFLEGMSGNEELGETSGLGVAVSFRALPWLKIRAGLDTRSGTHERTGITCLRVDPDIQCQPDQVFSESRLDVASVAVMPTWSPWESLQLSAGAGVALGRIRIDAAGATGRPAFLFAPKTAHLGIGVVSEIQYRPVAALPLMLVGAWQGRLLVLDGCITSDERYDPFCGGTFFGDLQIGIGVTFD